MRVLEVATEQFELSLRLILDIKSWPTSLFLIEVEFKDN